MHLSLIVVAISASLANSLNIVLTNDDGFEDKLIQSLFFELENAGHNVIMSAPYKGQGGTSGTIQPLQPLLPTSEASPGGTLPAGSQGVGPTTIAENQFYVAGAVTSAVWYGIDVLAPRLFDGKAPDLVIAGPNNGHITGLLTPFSANVLAAVTAINKGIPSIAFSTARRETNIELVSELAVKIVEDVFDSIRDGTGLNINIPLLSPDAAVDDYNLVSSKIGLNGAIGYLFTENLSECEYALDHGLDFSLPGLCLTYQLADAGYSTDNDPRSEFNVVAGDSTFSVSVSVIEGTFQAPTSIEVDTSIEVERVGAVSTAPLNIVLTNDDGFEDIWIQSLHFALEAAGHNVIMSAPYKGQGGTSGSIQPLQPLPPTSEASPGGTLPAGSPGVGPTTIAENQFYVAGAVTSAVWYGIDVLAPRLFDGKAPDLVIAGPNNGHTTGLLTPFSANVLAAVTAINKGIPSIAFSTARGETNIELVSELAVEIVETVFDSIPAGTGLSVNIPAVSSDASVEDFDLVPSRIGLNGLIGYLFVEKLSECQYAQDLGLNIPFPGLCLTHKIEDAGYAADNDVMSEYNVVSGDSTASVSISVIEGTFQAPASFELESGGDESPVDNNEIDLDSASPGIFWRPSYWMLLLAASFVPTFLH